VEGVEDLPIHHDINTFGEGLGGDDGDTDVESRVEDSLSIEPPVVKILISITVALDQVNW
jgi:hypothetical protein